MKKRKIRNIVLVVLLLVGTNIITFFSVMGIVLGDGGKFTKIAILEKYIKDNYLYDVSDEDFLNGELKGVVAALNDPYSEYYTKDEFKQLMDFTAGNFYGIGVEITKGEDNLITVITPIKDSPAERAGIKSGDKIIKVEGEEFSGDNLTDAVKKMKGEEGTKVNITVYSPKTTSTKDLELTREKIQVRSVISKKLNDIGYVGIIQFSENTANEFKEQVENLKNQGIQSLILDLRGNPGGIVDSAAEICDYILPEGEIVYAKNKEGKIVFNFKSDNNSLNMPLVVLINEGSASASEIVAGAIQDYKAGTIIGMKSFGKGIVQTSGKIFDGGIKLTTAEYFTPNGRNIHKKGIIPDIEIKEPEDIKGIGIDFMDTDTQLKKAIEVLSEAGK